MMFQKIIITEDIFHFRNQRQPCLLWEQISHLHTFTHILTHICSNIRSFAETCEHTYGLNEETEILCGFLKFVRNTERKKTNGMSGMLPTRSFQSDSGWQYFLRILIRFHYLFRLQPNQFSLLVVNIIIIQPPMLLRIFISYMI